MENWLAEIKLFPYNYCPRGWFPCDGRTLQVQQYAALYSLIGFTYGGNGSTTFCIPNLNNRVSLGTDQTNPNYALGKTAGEDTHTLIPTEVPPHTHQACGTSANADQQDPAGKIWANSTKQIYAGSNQTLDTAPIIASVGGGAAHDNHQPSLGLNYCIAWTGLYPTFP